MKCDMDYCGARAKYLVGLPDTPIKSAKHTPTCGQHLAFFVKEWLKHTYSVEILKVPKEPKR